MPSSSYGIQPIAALDNAVYVAGSFPSIDGEFRDGLACLGPSTAQAHEWNPTLNAAPLVISTSEQLIALGGDFRTVSLDGTVPLGGLAIYDRGPDVTRCTMAGDRLRLEMTSGDRACSVLQVSTDLLHWSDLSTNDAVGYSWTAEPAIDTSGWKFFRVVAR